MRSYLVLALCALILMQSAAPLAAGEFFWKSPVNGDFGNASNWQPVGVPGDLDSAIFDLGSSGYQVNFSASQVGQLQFNNDKLTLSGFLLFAAEPTGAAIQFGAGEGDVSDVTLNSGSLYGRRIFIADHENSEANIRSNGGEISTEFPLAIGGSPGELVIGSRGKATVDINGNVASAGSIILGRDSTSQGTLNLHRGNLTALGTGLVVGQAGKALLELTDRARGDVNGELSIAKEAGSQGEINVRNSQFGTPGYGNYRMTSSTIGGAGKGSLNFSDGSTSRMEGPIVLGRDAGAEGSLSIDGSFTNYELYVRTSNPPEPQSPGVTVGASGTGNLSVIGGARARLSGQVVAGQNSGSEGTIEIDGERTNVSRYGAGGAAPLSFVIGDAGTGELKVTGGAQAEGRVHVGKQATGQGTVTIDGIETRLLSSGLISGDAGKGAATISGGAFASFVGPVVLGKQATGVGTLAIHGASTEVMLNRTNLDELDRVVVGGKGNGSLTVSDQAVANFTDAALLVAAESGSFGNVTVQDAQTRLTVDRIDLGAGGTGKLSVLDQGQVIAWKQQSSVGAVEVRAGSTLELKNGGRLGDVARPVTVKNAGIIDNTGGTIFGSVNNVAGGSIVGSGAISGALTQTGGVISPGNSPGTLDVGSLSFAGGTLVIEMNSALGVAGGPIGWDLISSHGMAALTGPLSLELVSLSLDNQPGDVFDFDPNRSKSWTIIQGATGGSSIYDPNLITIDTSGFSNDFAGRFSLSVRGANIALTYMRPVPEPGTLLLAGLGVVAVVVAHRRRR